MYESGYFFFLVKRKNNKIIFANTAKWIYKSLAKKIFFIHLYAVFLLAKQLSLCCIYR